MGIFEWQSGYLGTKELIKSIMNSKCKTYAGGGSTIESINSFGVKDSFEHISSGGGAFLRLAPDFQNQSWYESVFNSKTQRSTRIG